MQPQPQPLLPHPQSLPQPPQHTNRTRMMIHQLLLLLHIVVTPFWISYLSFEPFARCSYYILCKKIKSVTVSFGSLKIYKFVQYFSSLCLTFRVGYCIISTTHLSNAPYQERRRNRSCEARQPSQKRETVLIPAEIFFPKDEETMQVNGRFGVSPRRFFVWVFQHTLVRRVFLCQSFYLRQSR